MPKVKVQFTDADTVPAALKSFAGSDNSVEVWVGDKVADETNPGLAANRDTALGEKKAIQDKYDNLLRSSNDANTELMELRNKVASGSQMSADDVELVNTVKAVRPGVKAKDLKTELEEVPTLRTRVTEIESREQNAKIFKASGFKNETVFNDLLSNKAKNPNVDKAYIETEKVDGNDVEVAYVDLKDATGKVTKQKLTDYVKGNTEWTPYAPMLEASPEQSQPWIHQAPAGGNGSAGDKGDPVDAFINDMNKKATEAGNPLGGAKAPTTGEGVKQN